MEEKVKDIEQILVHPDGIDLWKLREACFSEGGLVHGTYMCQQKRRARLTKKPRVANLSDGFFFFFFRLVAKESMAFIGGVAVHVESVSSATLGGKHAHARGGDDEHAGARRRRF